MAQSGKEILDGVVESVREAFREDRAILSFNEFFALVAQDPQRHLRSSAQYLVDMFDFFGREERPLPTGSVTRFKLFDAEFADDEVRVAGQENVTHAIYRLLANFARQGRVNKLILLHGPNGSAKSSIVRCIMAGMEHYARRPEGAVYSFNWIFPAEKLSSDGIGFGAARRGASGSSGSYAYLPADSIDARVPCLMHDHPLFLVPQAQRIELLHALMPDAVHPKDERAPVDGSRFSISDYLRTGDLCHKCRRIYDALLASYDGDANRVLNHIQIERVYLSRRYRRGAATVEPQMSVDARVQQVTADRSLAALPMALQHVSLFDPTGALVDANRGLLEFSDLLKRPVEAFKYLLGTVETAVVSMDSLMLYLDLVFVGSTNETYLDAFKQHADFPSFKGRIELVKVPYLVRYEDERAIYMPYITARVVGRHVAPHAVDVAALWAVLTRIRRSDASLYPKELAEVIGSLTPMEKLRLYDRGEVPERLTTREAKELRHVIAELYAESVSYPNYEGRFGASAREIRTALLNAAHHADYRCLSPLAVLDEIHGILANKSVYDFLKQEIVKGYHDHEDFLQQTEALFIDWIHDEVRESMGLASAASYLELFSRYVLHVTHWVKGEKMTDPTSGKSRDADQQFMAEIEKVLVSEGEKPEDFRKATIATIGARSLESPDNRPDYAATFPTYIEMLKQDFYTKRSADLRRINEEFLKYTSDERSSLDADATERIEQMLATLEGKHGYCLHCARDTVAYLLKTRYAE